MNHSHQKGAPFRMRRSLFTSEPRRNYLSLHGCWIDYDDFLIALIGIFHGISRAAGRRTVIERQYTVRVVDQIAIPGMITPAAVMQRQRNNVRRILQYAEVPLSPCFRPVIRLPFMGTTVISRMSGYSSPLTKSTCSAKRMSPPRAPPARKVSYPCAAHRMISSASVAFMRSAEADNSFSPKGSDSGRCPVNANLIV